MFRKKRTTDFTKCTFLAFLWAGLLAAVCLAQEPVSTPVENADQNQDTQVTDESQQQEQDQARPTDEQKKKEPIGPVGVASFADDVFQNARNHFGFSLDVYQVYSSNVSLDQTRMSSGISAVMPRFFFNAGKRKSSLHADFGTGYRFYNKSHRLDSGDYSGSVRYDRTISKRASFQMADQINSAYNDSWLSFSIFAPIRYDYDFTHEVLVDRQRIFRNDFQARYSYEFTRRLHASLYGISQSYKYQRNVSGNGSSFEGGASLDIRIWKWLSLSNSYMAYIYIADERFRQNRMHELQIGGLNFHLGRSLRMWVSGGATLGNQNNEFVSRPSFNGGISYDSRNPTITITHQRSMSSPRGVPMPASLLRTSVTAATFGYRLNRRVGVSLQSYYYRSREWNSDGLLETLGGGGGLNFALRRDLFLTTNSYYQNQRTHNFSLQGLSLSRFTAYLGLQYVWPSLRRGNYR